MSEIITKITQLWSGFRYKYEFLISFCIVILVLLSIVFYHGYAYGINNHSEFIPLVKRFQDSSYLTNDWFLNVTSDTSVRYFSFEMITLISNIVGSNEIAFRLLYFASMILLIGGLYSFGSFFVKSPVTSFLFIFISFLAFPTTLGATSLWTNYLNTSMIAYALVFWGLSFILRNRVLLGACILAFSAYLHLQIGALYLGLTCILLLISKRYQSLLRFLLFYSVCVIPLSVFLFPVYVQPLATVSQEILFDILMRFRAPHHYLPSHYPLSEWLSLLIFTGFSLLAFKISSKTMLLNQKKLTVIIWYIIGSIIVGTIFTEIYPQYGIAQFQFFRMSVLLNVILSLLCAIGLSSALHKSKDSVLHLALTVLVLLSINRPETIAISTIFIIVFSLVKNMNVLISYSISTLYFIAIMIMEYTYLKQSLHTLFAITNSTTVIVILLVTVIAIALFVKILITLQSSVTEISTKTLLVVVTVTLLVTTTIMADNNSLLVKKYRQGTMVKPYQSWLKNNTPEQSLILAPYGEDEIALNASRANVVSHKSVPHSPLEIVEWKQRFDDILMLRTPSDSTLRLLINRYSPDYLILKTKITTEIDSIRYVYGDNDYYVYEVNNN